MASKLAKRRTAPAPRRSGNRKANTQLERVKRSAANRAARTRKDKEATKAGLVSLGGAAVLGILDRKGIELPKVGGMGNAAMAGLALYLAPVVIKGSTGQMLRDASIGALSIAAYEFAEESDVLDFLD